jgi:sigma-B regulation protein RsbU (phosphoserine phosphatase)
MGKYMTEDYRKLISRSTLFDKVSLEGMAHLLESCPLKELKQGEALLKPGQRNDQLYLIVTGSFSVHLSDPSKSPFLVLDAGECVGEISVFTAATVSAYVIAQQDSVLLTIKQSTLWSMTRISHGLARNLLQILAQRLQHNNRFIAEVAN